MKINNLKPIIFLVAIIFAAGCGKKKDSPFDRPATEPLLSSEPTVIYKPGDNGALVPIRSTKYCYLNNDGSYTDAVAIDKGHDDAKNFNWGQGGACVKRSIRETWATLHNQGLMAWDGITSSTYNVRADLPEGVSHFYEVIYKVVKVFITVDWTMNWYHSISKGTMKKPEQIVINYKKVSGTSHIRYWEGSIILDYISDSITAIAMRDQIDADQTSDDDARGSVNDVIRKARTGDPNWEPIGGAKLTPLD